MIFDELPPYREAMARGDWERAFSLLDAKAGAGGWRALSPEEALRLAALLGVRGRIDEATAVLRALEEDRDRRIAVQAILQHAGLRLSSPDFSLDEIERSIDRAAALAGEELWLQGRVAHARSRLQWKRSRIKEAGALLEEARRSLEDAGDDEEIAKVLDSLAMYHEHCGEREKALSCYSLSLSKKALSRDLFGIGVTLGNLGRFHLRMGEPRVALSCLQDDLRIARRIGDLNAQVVVKINIGQALTELKRLEEARRELEEALSMARAQGFKQQEVYALKDLARTMALKGDRAQARNLLDSALGLLPAEASYIKGQVLLARAEFFFESEEFPAARDSFEEARRSFQALRASLEEAMAIYGLARISEKLKEWNSCLWYLEEGMNHMSTISAPLASSLKDTFGRLQSVSRDRLIPQSIGPYRILSRLGAGTFGDVYKAFDGRVGASRLDVAVKVLRLESARDETGRKDRINRFHRECEILAQISHPNVVRLLDSGKESDIYMVQEFIGGGDLAALLKAGTPPVARAVAIMKGILLGLAALHENGIIHRDLKPGNVVLRESGEPVIADFGIARMVDLTALTLESMVMGTLGYMSPEQLRGDAVDEGTDIYGVGIIFFELLTGRLPYQENTIQEILRTLEEDRILDLSKLRPELPEGLVRCVRRCLQKDRKQRYATVRDMIRDLEEFSSRMA